MSRSTPKLHDPALNDFVYSVLYNATSDEKKNLPRHYLRLVNREAQAKKFANHAGLEEKLILLSYFGIDYVLVVAEKAKAKQKALREIIEKHKLDSDDDEWVRLYMANSKTIMHNITVMAQSIHHKTFIQSMEYTRASYRIGNWERQLKRSSELAEVDEAVTAMSSLFLNGYLSFVDSNGLLLLTELQVAILLYLYPLKHLFIAYEKIWARIEGMTSKMELTYALNKLEEINHISKNQIAKTREYSISALGIIAVNKFIQRVFQINEYA